MKLFKKTFFTILSFLLLAPAASAGLYGLDNTGAAAGLPGRDTSLAAQVGTIINGALGVIGIVFLILAIYGGFRILLSGGNQEHVKKGRDTLIYAIIGMLIITLAYAITSFVFTQVIGVGGEAAATPAAPAAQ